MMSSCSIGVISDIHANLHALLPVIQHARQHQVDQIWNAGDIVGYGVFPNEVIELLKSEHVMSIRGNYDTKVLKIPKKKNCWANSKVPIKWIAMSWAYQHLSKDNRKYLAQLPEKINLEINGLKILLLHGSPVSPEEPLLPTTPDERFLTLAGIANADIIICGHSHQAFSRKFGNIHFLNPGSVGRQDDGDPRASYAIMTLTRNAVEFKMFRISYNYQEAAKAIRRYNLPEQFAQLVLNGSGFTDL